MDEIVILAKSGSRDEPYSVVFTLRNGILTISCDCKAGKFGQLCRHKIGLASNKDSMLFDRGQADELKKVNEWVKASELPKAIQQIKSVESEIEDAKKRLKSIKARAARLMRDGTS